jgi:GNAT superfamily N-acetyltransferase
MQIIQSSIDDKQTIFALYDAAIAHQKQVSNLHWLPFDEALVEREIEEGRQWKILLDGRVAGVFVVAYNDPDIWGEKDAEPSVYLHRIVTHPDFRGRNLVLAITEWAKEHGKALGRKFLRLDTWAENLKLRELYRRAGYRFLGDAPPANPAGLPSHYSGILLGFYEIALVD